MAQIRFGTIDNEFKNKQLIQHLKNTLMKHFFNKDTTDETLNVIVKVFAEIIDSYLKQTKKKVAYKVSANFDDNLDVVIDIRRK